MKEITSGDVIQLTETAPAGWEGCLMTVEEVTEWGVLAYTKIPCKGEAYLRVYWREFELIGHAVLIRRGEETSE